MAFIQRTRNAAAAFASIFPVPIEVLFVILLYTSAPILVLLPFFPRLFWIIPRLALCIFVPPLLVGILKWILDVLRSNYVELLFLLVEFLGRLLLKILEYVIIGFTIVALDSFERNVETCRGFKAVGCWIWFVFRRPTTFIFWTIVYALGRLYTAVAWICGRMAMSLIKAIDLCDAARLYAKKQYPFWKRQTDLAMVELDFRKNVVWFDFKDYITPKLIAARKKLRRAPWDLRVHSLVHVIFGLVQIFRHNLDQPRHSAWADSWQAAGLEWHTFICGTIYAALKLAQEYTRLCKRSDGKITEDGETDYATDDEESQANDDENELSKVVENDTPSLFKHAHCKFGKPYNPSTAETEKARFSLNTRREWDRPLPRPLNLKPKKRPHDFTIDTCHKNAFSQQHERMLGQLIHQNSLESLSPKEKLQAIIKYQDDTYMDPDAEPAETYQHWYNRTLTRSNHGSELKDFPAPRFNKCPNYLCIQNDGNKLHLCVHNIEPFFRDAGLPYRDLLLEERRRWQRERYTRIKNKETRLDVMQKADAFGDVLDRLVDEYERAEKSMIGSQLKRWSYAI